MHSWRSIARIAVVLIAAQCGGCAPRSAYLRAVASYADTTEAGVTSLGSVPTMAATICRKRAVARYLERHIRLGISVTWNAYYEAPGTADAQLSWKDYCADIQATGANLGTIVGLLASYANAMKALASEGQWDGAALQGSLASLSTLAGATTPAGETLSRVSAPAKQLGSLLVASYTAEHARQFAATADAPVQALLTAVDDYIAAVNRDVVVPCKEERKGAVNLLELRGDVWGSPLDAARIIAFTGYAQSVDDDVANVDAAFAGYAKLIARLKSAHTTLATRPAQSSSAKDIEAAVTEMLVALTEIDTATGNTRSEGVRDERRP